MTDPYAELAAQLHALADQVAALAGTGLPAPWVSVSIQPGGTGHSDTARTAAVDRVAQVVCGRPGHTVPAAGGRVLHVAEGTYGPARVAVFEALDALQEVLR